MQSKEKVYRVLRGEIIMVNKVFEMYKNINLGNNETCQRCKDFHKGINSELYTPASLWNVGDKFETDQYKVMFVGKPARGLPGEKIQVMAF